VGLPLGSFETAVEAGLVARLVALAAVMTEAT
jgi:hypothetical protein